MKGARTARNDSSQHALDVEVCAENSYNNIFTTKETLYIYIAEIAANYFRPSVLTTSKSDHHPYNNYFLPVLLCCHIIMVLQS